jgi:hypothetical protein
MIISIETSTNPHTTSLLNYTHNQYLLIWWIWKVTHDITRKIDWFLRSCLLNFFLVDGTHQFNSYPTIISMKDIRLPIRNRLDFVLLLTSRRGGGSWQWFNHWREYTHIFHWFLLIVLEMIHLNSTSFVLIQSILIHVIHVHRMRNEFERDKYYRTSNEIDFTIDFSCQQSRKHETTFQRAYIQHHASR